MCLSAVTQSNTLYRCYHRLISWHATLSDVLTSCFNLKRFYYHSWSETSIISIYHAKNVDKTNNSYILYTHRSPTFPVRTLISLSMEPSTVRSENCTRNIINRNQRLMQQIIDRNRFYVATGIDWCGNFLEIARNCCGGPIISADSGVSLHVACRDNCSEWTMWTPPCNLRWKRCHQCICLSSASMHLVSM